ncbi:SMP-30/gluconolactonase/LRE family protein [candidate division WOR-3 bacterium]|nr:SMP-30/gluconolactonase/LRE family protein [candidate division WOR-3 bacterium]
MKKLIFSLLLIVFTVSCTAKDKSYMEGIGPVSPVKKVQGDFQFTEGPASDMEGNLYFSDVSANKIYKMNTAGEISVFLEPSGHANGLMFADKNNLIVCQMDGQLVSINTETKKITVLTDKYEGNRYNAPNDLVVDKTGGVYFTDPRFRAPQPLPQEKQGVYYRNSEGEVTLLLDNLKAPNGIILSLDEKTLYVIPSMQKDMWAYSVTSPGKLGEGKVYCELSQAEGKDNSGGDGVTIDSKGNLYIATGLGIQVFNVEGKLLGIIEFPEQPANLTFGGSEMKTLYVTARTSLYSAEMEIAGHSFSHKE